MFEPLRSLTAAIAALVIIAGCATVTTPPAQPENIAIAEPTPSVEEPTGRVASFAIPQQTASDARNEVEAPAPVPQSPNSPPVAASLPKLVVSELRWTSVSIGPKVATWEIAGVIAQKKPYRPDLMMKNLLLVFCSADCHEVASPL